MRVQAGTRSCNVTVFLVDSGPKQTEKNFDGGGAVGSVSNRVPSGEQLPAVGQGVWLADRGCQIDDRAALFGHPHAVTGNSRPRSIQCRR
jgi:hypothetical protein